MTDKLVFLCTMLSCSFSPPSRLIQTEPPKVLLTAHTKIALLIVYFTALTAWPKLPSAAESPCNPPQ